MAKCFKKYKPSTVIYIHLLNANSDVKFLN